MGGLDLVRLVLRGGGRLDLVSTFVDARQIASVK